MQSIVCSLKEKNAIGHIILDHYIRGDAFRISPEDAVHIINVIKTTYNAGGASNAVLNLSNLNIDVSSLFCSANDNDGKILHTMQNLITR